MYWYRFSRRRLHGTWFWRTQYPSPETGGECEAFFFPEPTSSWEFRVYLNLQTIAWYWSLDLKYTQGLTKYQLENNLQVYLRGGKWSVSKQIKELKRKQESGSKNNTSKEPEIGTTRARVSSVNRAQMMSKAKWVVRNPVNPSFFGTLRLQGWSVQRPTRTLHAALDSDNKGSI